MDVAMPRKDFEKFRELTMDGKLGDYEIRSIIHTPDLHVRPFDRLVDTKYMTKTKLEQKFIPPWLDMHALDGLPTGERKDFEHWNAVGKLKRKSKISRTPFKMTKGRLKRLLKPFVYFPYKIAGPVKYAKSMIDLAYSYDFDEAEYIAAFVAGYGRKERMPKAWFMVGGSQSYIPYEVNEKLYK